MAYRKHVVFDGHQRMLLEVMHPGSTYAKAYLTVVSRNMLTDAPIVIGPVELNREQWLTMARHCRSIADLLSKRVYEYERPKIY